MLVLASNSPRRKQLLRLAGWDFSVILPQVDETVRPSETPREYVRRMAQTKAIAALNFYGDQLESEAVILAADTAVVDVENHDGLTMGILGKPSDAAEAEWMLFRLRGGTHHVLTGLAGLRIRDRDMHTAVIVTEVSMRDYTEGEIQAYIASGDPFDKAGAYAIQHPVFQPVRNLHGCYPNVMGLPVCEVGRLLAGFGFPSQGELLKACSDKPSGPCAVYEAALADGS